MIPQFKYLFGKDHNDPSNYNTFSLGDNLVAGIAQIITKEDKRHNFADNEDASGIYLDGGVSICMVADAHWGYVASHEAVQRFPGIFVRHLRENAGSDPRQTYLESILMLCKQVAEAVEWSDVSYGERFGQKVLDKSTSQFYSVVKVGENYYFVGLGDCSCVIITPENVVPIPSQNHFFRSLGSLDPRMYMGKNPDSEGLQKGGELHFDDPLVRKGVDVQQLNVDRGDIIFLHTDGYNIRTGERVLGSFSELFNKLSLSDTVNKIMKSAVENRKQLYDNIAVAAMRVV